MPAISMVCPTSRSLSEREVQVFSSRVLSRNKRNGACRAIARQAGLSAIGGLFLCSIALPAAMAESPPSLALSGFFLLDTSGEQRDQTAEHNARLARFDGIMRDELSKSGKFALVNMNCPQPGCTAQSVKLDQLLESAKAAGARFLVIGAVEKMSTLVLWARLEVYDVASRQMVFNRLFTFRGDNDEAWQRAAHYIANELIKNAPAN
ncbi:DUF2380 domain-containing protein [Pseudaminobacter soli (ex Li et al. 2025)]|nr:DUF2380 domain-containing protein [Mesorhizobium soli]